MGFVQRAIQNVYSITAEKIYEPLVVQGSFKLLGRDLHERVTDQGRRAARAAGGDPVLDVPVGTAYFTLELARAHDGLVAGSDIAWGMVAESRRAAVREGAANLVPVQSNIHALPFAADSFGAVVCHNGLQVIPGLTRALEEIHRTLKPGGPLFVSVVSAPIGALLPRSVAARLPTILRSGFDVADAIAGAGFEIAWAERSRWAYFIEALKPTAPP